MDCLDCEDGLEHCHEVLVVHLDATMSCVDPACDGSPELHEWISSCLDLNWPCYCQRTGHAQPLAA